MRCVVLALSLGVLVAASAYAKTEVSPAFDGNYHANLNPVPGMSNAECQPFMIAAMTIAQGQIKSAPSAGATVQGIVTQDGFLTGAFIKADKTRLTFEGRFIDKDFSGAVIDKACAWTITLTPVP